MTDIVIIEAMGTNVSKSPRDEASNIVGLFMDDGFVELSIVFCLSRKLPVYPCVTVTSIPFTFQRNTSFATMYFLSFCLHVVATRLVIVLRVLNTLMYMWYLYY